MAGEIVPDESASAFNYALVRAMKMEHSIAAPADGTVAEVHYALGDPDEEGTELIAFERRGTSP